MVHMQSARLNHFSQFQIFQINNCIYWFLPTYSLSRQAITETLYECPMSDDHATLAHAKTTAKSSGKGQHNARTDLPGKMERRIND